MILSQSFNNAQVARLTNIELLRIVAMFLIVLHHGVVHGNLNFTGSLDVNKLFLSLFIFGGKFGVNIFVLISGYFLCRASFSMRKVSKILGEILFYIIIVLSFVIVFFYDSITYERIVSCIYPYQGFAVNYIYLYILFPYINKTLQCLSRENILKLLLFLVFIMSFLTTFLPKFDGFWLLSWLVLLYMIGGYIRNYITYTIITKYHNKFLMITIGLILLTNAVTGIIHFMKESFLSKSFFWLDERTLFADNSFTLLVASICFFMYFLGMNIDSSLINNISSKMFGVLLIHDNPFRFIIFEDILKLDVYQQYLLFPMYFLFAMLSIFFVGVFVSTIRKKFFENIFTNICEKLIMKMAEIVNEKIIYLLR